MANFAKPSLAAVTPLSSLMPRPADSVRWPLVFQRSRGRTSIVVDPGVLAPLWILNVVLLPLLFGLGTYGTTRSILSSGDLWLACAFGTAMGGLLGSITLRKSTRAWRESVGNAGAVFLIKEDLGDLQLPRLGLTIPTHAVIGIEVVIGTIKGLDATKELAICPIAQVLLVFQENSGRVVRRLIFECTPSLSIIQLQTLGYAVRTTQAGNHSTQILNRHAPLSSSVYTWSIDGNDSASVGRFGITANRCPQCNYDIRTLKIARCPECGLDVRDEPREELDSLRG